MMYNIKTLNKIAACGTDLFDRGKYAVTDNSDTPDAILLRSASMHDMEFNPELLAIGRAGAGTNNIPVDKCSEKGIVVFNTPGANANGVKELTICGLLLASRKITAAIDECKTLCGKGDEVPKLVEKVKGAYGGCEIKGKKLGVVGLGAIGALVANAASDLGMEVYGFDPFLSVGGALSLSRKLKYVKAVKEIYENCDYISLNAPVTPETKGMINSAAISSMKKNVRILNFARSELVDENAVIDALKNGGMACYITDFPTDKILTGAKELEESGKVGCVVTIPHLGASTEESEDNCAIMAANQVIDYIENGNIINSVNLPNVSMAKSGDFRLCVVHKNIDGVLTKITDIGQNIENMESRSKGDYAYTILDVKGSSDAVAERVKGIGEVISVRILK